MINNLPEFLSISNMVDEPTALPMIHYRPVHDASVLGNPFNGSDSEVVIKAYREWLWLNLQSVKTGERMVNVYKIAKKHGVEIAKKRRLTTCREVIQEMNQIIEAMEFCPEVRLMGTTAEETLHADVIVKCVYWIKEQLPPWRVWDMAETAVLGESLNQDLQEHRCGDVALTA